MICELLYEIQGAVSRIIPPRKLGIRQMHGVPFRGRALISYLPMPVFGKAEALRGHSNVWECSEIVRCFTHLGYQVDLIAWNDVTFVPSKPYDVVFDIHRNLSRYADSQTMKIFHVTGSNPVYSNAAEAVRLAALRERRSCELAPRRWISAQDMTLFEQNLAAADTVTLIGNEMTLATFPASVHHKIRPIIATGSWLPPDMMMPRTRFNREFLWFNSAGAVHKGLDLVLEVFARHPELTLHVVGHYLRERDFVNEYGSELFRLSNIHSHGFLYPGSRTFRNVLQRTGFLINPSCSEGISTSAITCMQAGLVPLLSRNCGISLPEGAGWIFKELSIAEVEATLLAASSHDDATLMDMAENCRKFAHVTFNRSRFSQLLTETIEQAVGHSQRVQGI